MTHLQTIKQELRGVLANPEAIADVEPTDDLRNVAQMDSLGFIQFLSALERRFDLDLSTDMAALQRANSLADIDLLICRLQGATDDAK